MSERPKCVGCAKPLRKHTVTVYEEELHRHYLGTITCSNEDGRPLVVGDRRVKEITRTVTGSRPSYNRWHVWLGDYGYDGYSLFCSKTCAAYWARDIMLAIRSGQVKLNRIQARAARRAQEVNL